MKRVRRKIERSGKRLLIRLLTAIFRSEKVSRESIFARSPRRILVIRQHNQMGDMLLATPAFRAIKRALGPEELAVVTSRINRDVLINNPFIDRVYTYDKRVPWSVVPFIYSLRRRRFDIAIVLHTVSFSFTSAILGVLCGARFRVGSTSLPFGHRLSDALYHLELPLPREEELRDMNEAEHNLYPLRALGVDETDLRPELVPPELSETWAERFVSEAAGHSPVVAVHPGAGKRENIWAPENFADVVNAISREKSVSVIAVEGPRDARSVRAFRRRLGRACTILRSRSIGDVAAVLKRSSLVLCNDTGVMHAACACGATTLAIFGPTDPVRWAPRCPGLHIIRAEAGDLRRVTTTEVSVRAIELLGSVDRAQGDV